MPLLLNFNKLKLRLAYSTIALEQVKRCIPKFATCSCTWVSADIVVVVIESLKPLARVAAVRLALPLLSPLTLMSFLRSARSYKLARSKAFVERLLSDDVNAITSPDRLETVNPSVQN